MVDSSGEGYDYQFVNPGPTDDQKCPICHLVVRDVYQVTCCGKLLCNGCLTRCRNGSNNCPMCRENIGNKYFQDTRGDREIKSLRVYCNYKDAGCKWIGELRDVEKHMNTCNYQTVQCPDCKSTLLKRNLDKHRSDKCKMRKYKCPLCMEEGTYLSITTAVHIDECPEVILECQNADCSEHVKRCEMSSHIAVCPKQVIKCPFTDMGCKVILKREDLPVHVKQNIAVHMDMMIKEPQFHHRDVAPIVLKYTGYSNGKESDEVWYSEGFYTGVGGYKVQLRVVPNGSGDGKSTHLSVFIKLMPGANDDTIVFPLRGTFTISLLNQQVDDNHRTTSLTFDDNTPERCCGRQYELDGAKGWGYAKFLSHSSLGSNPVNNIRQYLHNDTLYFRVTAEISSKTKPWLAIM